MSQENDDIPGNQPIDEERQQRYIKWKKNTRLLYDYLNTNSSKWPSLTCQFFPDLDTTTDTHRLLLSSFTSSQLPDDESLYIAKISTLGHLSWSSLNNFDMDEMEFKPDNSTKLPPKNLVSEISIRFPGGDCNRARYLPQNPDVISAASSDGSIYVFDRTKHGTTVSRSATPKPYEIRLSTASDIVHVDQLNEAVSLDWNRRKEGLLASCYAGGQILVWDISQYARSNPLIDTPVCSLQFDTEGANDVTWMPSHDSLLAACGESNTVALYDTRTGTSVSATQAHLHAGGANSCDFNPHNDFLLASADGNGSLNLWDIRKLDRSPIQTIVHGSSVSTIKWNPKMETVIALAGQDDGLVKLWDAASGQLIFTHGGHMLGVNDIAWSPHDPHLMCSVSNDNSVHVWRPSSHLIEAQN
ncbi:hypothetical protein HG536_0D00980 [Torulaspora globosa]|uniref:Uncharacterized protein n=1 Tax=Torulaspora globosa TaxID=48254 RepID=A0A7G3ZGE0_9SACH|nr:uncharacterized protein HG536_0D00980 [Torulaspora globosa]QLL32576.1 hypothetical protein HG536_0D00980 [Torulaspora globosa]